MIYSSNDTQDVQVIIAHRLREIKGFAENGKIRLKIAANLAEIIESINPEEQGGYDLRKIATDLGKFLYHCYLMPGYTFPVKVKCQMSVKDMVEVGQYDGGTIEFFIKNFFVPQNEEEYEVQLRLRCFQGKIDVDQARREVSYNKERFASLAEFLSFGYQHPDIQRIYNKIMTLGSDCEFFKEIPKLWGGSHHDDYNCLNRNLGLGFGETQMRGINYFLVTDK